ncbi:MAG: M20 family metallopeptidase [Planctomycetota bacterium]|jgi:succinyl-diaminopimelate desuccinylase
MKELLKQLIQADTTFQNGELAAAKIIAEYLHPAGIDCCIDCWDKNRANMVGWVKSGSASKTILFACHLDVVPVGEGTWEYPPFSGDEKDGRVYGRGSTDMKGGITAIATALKEVIESGHKLNADIILFCGAGEETDSCGAIRFVEKYSSEMPKLDGIIIPEPTDFEVVTAHRGMLWLKIITKGKAAHSSTPELGVNAISSMNKVLAVLENHKIDVEPNELLGECSMSVNTITGGNAINIVPDRCEIGVDIRTLPGQDINKIISDIQDLCSKLKAENTDLDAEVIFDREVGALLTDTNCQFVKEFCSVVEADQTKAVGFTTDGPNFKELNAPVVIFGPGKPDLCHKPNEYIEISDLEKAVEIYKRFIFKYLF